MTIFLSALNQLSPEFQVVIDTDLVKLRVGADYCIELGFDGVMQGQWVDFRPIAPDFKLVRDLLLIKVLIKVPRNLKVDIMIGRVEK